MPEKLRIVCPICGMMSDLEQLQKTSENKPAEVRLKQQKWGGKLPAGVPVEGDLVTKKGRGSAPGYMVYEDITDQIPDEVEKVRKFFDDRIELYQSGKGEP
ncbi:MAG: hypothetical protein Q8P59_01950 [Dehalococcoidia bacterium]|nr:hypothetical protein [Dehalococcoidia bacterium]